MFEIHNAVGNEDSRLSGKETLGTDDIVLKRSGVRRCYGLGSGEGRHTENVAGDMRTYWGPPDQTSSRWKRGPVNKVRKHEVMERVH